MRRAGRLDEAASHYRRAVAMVSEPDVFNDFGLVLFQQHKLDEAGEQFRLGLALNPNSAQLVNNLGAVLLEQSRLDEAGPYFLRAIDIDPILLDPRVNLVRLLVKRGQLDDAISQCRAILKIAPGDPTVPRNDRVLYQIQVRASQR